MKPLVTFEGRRLDPIVGRMLFFTNSPTVEFVSKDLTTSIPLTPYFNIDQEVSPDNGFTLLVEGDSGFISVKHSAFTKSVVVGPPPATGFRLLDCRATRMETGEPVITSLDEYSPASSHSSGKHVIYVSYSDNSSNSYPWGGSPDDVMTSTQLNVVGLTQTELYALGWGSFD